MKVIVKNEAKIYKNIYFDKMDAGSLFIYPTDTIYGIGCDATNESSVHKVREAKERMESPFSVIAPSKEWILENCEVTEDELEELPGPVTLIVKLKNKDAIASNVAPNLDTIGVRIPDHWISSYVSEYGKPILTTSVNKVSEPFMTNIEEVHPDIKGKVHFAINEGIINGRPSKIINLVEKHVIER
ncbi:Sua5/YciO/YrdC/YwlC family protein [Candidatus Woesearchaeota archaeon]|nr:Sua5/YciO/YrdC/YwlC family protein [Candidatus Woesearchaeota archaeon]